MRPPTESDDDGPSIIAGATWMGSFRAAGYLVLMRTSSASDGALLVSAMCRFLTLAILFFLCAVSTAFAQFETAALVGTVTDGSGGVVADALITATNIDTGVTQTRRTDANGHYEFVTLRIGNYLVTAEKAGFALALAENVRLEVGARLRVDLGLQVGQLTERIEVSAAATLLETDTSQRGQIITGEQTRALPLNGREYSALALLTTGVRLSALNTGGFTPREGSFNVNGLRSTFNNFLIDGVDNNAYGTSNQGFSNQVMQPPPDAVGEFKVVTNNMSAEYGRSAGATINVAYASGTNRVRGSAWEFLRDTSLNATGFFKPANGEKPPLERNQFGGVIGGPIVRNRAFFFADYEGFRQMRGVPASSTIPTLAQRQGILTVDGPEPDHRRDLPGRDADPDDGVRPQGADRAAGAHQQRRARTTTSLLQQFDNTTDKFGGKVDVTHQPAADRLRAVRLSRRRTSTISRRSRCRRAAAATPQTYVTNKQLAAGVTYIPSATSLLEVRFGWSKTTGGEEPGGARLDVGARRLRHHRSADRSARGRRAADAAHHGLSRSRPPGDQPAVAVPDGLQPEGELHVDRRPPLAEERLRVSAHPDRSAGREPALRPRQYAGQFTRPAGAAANNIYNLADFMLGLRSTFALSNILVANLRQNMHFLYLQDDLRVNDRLTLNLGLRYEYATPWVERDNILSNFDPATRQMVLARDGSLEDRATGEARSQQLRSAARPGLHADRQDRAARRLRRELRALPSRRRRQRAADQRSAGHQRRRRAEQPARSRRSAAPSRDTTRA